MSLYLTTVLPASMPSAALKVIVIVGPSLRIRWTAMPIATTAASTGMTQTTEIRARRRGTRGEATLPPLPPRSPTACAPSPCPPGPPPDAGSPLEPQAQPVADRLLVRRRLRVDRVGESAKLRVVDLIATHDVQAYEKDPRHGNLRPGLSPPIQHPIVEPLQVGISAQSYLSRLAEDVAQQPIPVPAAPAGIRHPEVGLEGRGTGHTRWGNAGGGAVMLLLLRFGQGAGVAPIRFDLALPRRRR
jgi:hypothetical protein